MLFQFFPLFSVFSNRKTLSVLLNLPVDTVAVFSSGSIIQIITPSLKKTQQVKIPLTYCSDFITFITEVGICANNQIKRLAFMLLGPPSTQISISPLFFCFSVSSSTLCTASVSPSTHAAITGFHHHRQPYLGTHLCPSLLLRPHSHRLLTFPRRSHVQQHGQDRGGPEDR